MRKNRHNGISRATEVGETYTLAYQLTGIGKG